MGKVKAKANMKIGNKTSYQFPMGKVKSEVIHLRVELYYSIGVSIPNGKGKEQQFKVHFYYTYQIWLCQVGN